MMDKVEVARWRKPDVDHHDDPFQSHQYWLAEQRRALQAEDRRPADDAHNDEYLRKHRGVEHRGWHGADFVLLPTDQQVAILSCSTTQLQSFSLNQRCEICGMQVSCYIVLALYSMFLKTQAWC
jgi:hypothetical protein